MEGLRQIMVETVGGKISGAVAKKLSNGDEIVEKLLDKGVEKSLGSGSINLIRSAEVIFLLWIGENMQ